MLESQNIRKLGCSAPSCRETPDSQKWSQILRRSRVSLGYPFYAWGMAMEQAFNGAGDTATPTWINFGCYWCVQIPLAWYLAQHLGPRGVYLAICGAESALAVVSVILFRRGKWKTVAV